MNNQFDSCLFHKAGKPAWLFVLRTSQIAFIRQKKAFAFFSCGSLNVKTFSEWRNNMKLATALSERADLQARLSELSVRLGNNSKVQEGEEPSESPEELLEELDRTISRLEELISRINLTNSATERDGKTITQLLAHRDCTKSKIQIMRNFLDNSSCKVNRMTHTEIKIKSTVPVSEIQKKVDALSKEMRETDELIQELNWTTELL